MAVNYGGIRPVAIALIVEDEHGYTVFGSQRIYDSQVSMQTDYGEGTLLGSRSRMYTGGLQSFSISAECGDMTVMRRLAIGAAVPPQQRGIYLPDMSFRALPELGDG